MAAQWRYWIAGIAAILYVASLLLPTVDPFNPYSNNSNVGSGWDAFRAAWQVMWMLGLGYADWWVLAGACMANLLIWTALAATLASRRQLARFTAAARCCCA